LRSPGKARAVVDAYRRNAEPLRVQINELQERLDATQHADRSRRREPRLLWRYFELIRLIFLHRLHRFASVVALDLERCLRRFAFQGLAERDSRLRRETTEKPRGSPL